MSRVDAAALAKAEEEFNSAEHTYQQAQSVYQLKRAQLIELAKAVLAANPVDAGVNTKGQGGPLKGHS